MSKRTLLRLISLIMFIIAVVFVFIAISVPTLGKIICCSTAIDSATNNYNVCYLTHHNHLHLLQVCTSQLVS